MGCRTTDRAVLFDDTLPAAGEYTEYVFLVLEPCTNCVTFWITYTSAAPPAGGPSFRVEWTNGTDESRALIMDTSSLVVVQPEGFVNVPMETLVGPRPADGTPISYIMQFDVPCGATGVRLNAAESGAVGTPGDLLIAATASRDC